MQYRKLIELKELPNNPRLIKSKQFDILCKSIQDNPEYFEARPIILSDRTGELIIIAGNQRYKAAKHLKLIEVPTYLMENLTEEKEREIIIRDNVSNGEWDFDILANEWQTDLLTEWGVDIPNWEDQNEETLKEVDEEIRPYTKVHFLISIEPENINDIAEQLEIIKNTIGVEYETSSN